MVHTYFSEQLLCKTPFRRLRTLDRFKRQTFFHGTTFDLALLQRQPVEVSDVWMQSVWLFPHKIQTSVRLFKKLANSVIFFLIVALQVILELRERPDRAAKARRGLTLSLQPLKGFDYDSLLSPPATPDTQLDTDTQTQTAAPLPGPALRLQPVQEKGPRREVFV